MTILTKSAGVKKLEKIFLPISGSARDDNYHRNLLEHQHNGGTRPDGDVESMVFNRPQFSCLKTILLFVISIMVMLCGVLGGYALYSMYAPSHSRMQYRAVCDIPYETLDSENNTAPRVYLRNELNWLWPDIFSNNKLEYMNKLMDDTYFREEVEVDLSDKENYAKVEVPDFKEGRHGRFMHDFKENQTAIIDISAKRCFIMPLDWETVLPPKSFMDLMDKMSSGYYNVNTERVRRNMRVVTPPITDLTIISERIANECYDMKVYKLENYVSSVYKREANTPIMKNYAEFAGKNIVEFSIINLKDLDEYENQQSK